MRDHFGAFILGNFGRIDRIKPVAIFGQMTCLSIPNSSVSSTLNSVGCSKAFETEGLLFHVRFPPTSAPRLNMVERFFRDLSAKRTKRGAHNSAAFHKCARRRPRRRRHATPHLDSQGTRVLGKRHPRQKVYRSVPVRLTGSTRKHLGTKATKYLRAFFTSYSHRKISSTPSQLRPFLRLTVRHPTTRQIMWNPSGKLEERRVIGQIRHSAPLNEGSDIEITNRSDYYHYCIFSIVNASL